MTVTFLKTCQNKSHRGWYWTLCSGGWLVALILVGWTAPRIYERLIFHWPAARQQEWRQTLAGKQKQLSAPWRDPRPLILFVGDSEIERGNWYDLFQGNWAVRNSGLSRAKIKDVTQLAAALGDRHAQGVVLMCGVNSVGGETLADCLQDYAALIHTVRSQLEPKFILVLSVMPVRESAVDREAHRFNATIAAFNGQLAAYCRQQPRVTFLDVNPAVQDARGGLADDLTVDGLHLNEQGYQQLAQVIAPRLVLLASPS